MIKNLKNYLVAHKKGALTGFVVALFALGAMLLGRAGHLGNFEGNLTGAMFRARQTVSRTGTVNLKQNFTGVVDLIDPKSVRTTISTPTYTNTMATMGKYTLGTITPPVGYALSTVMNAGNKNLTAPYAQTLYPGGGAVGFNVSYKALGICGNSIIDAGEVCDDGNAVTETTCGYDQKCLACNATCTQALSQTGAYCGDGSINGGNEACDDGNALNEDGCSDKCVIEPSKSIAPFGSLNIEGKAPSDDGSGQPKSSILIAGSLAQPVASLTFTAKDEAFTVTKLTLINDNNKVGDVPLDTSAIKIVLLKYSDKNGITQTTRGTLSGGKVTITGLSFYIPSNSSADLSVAVDISHMMDVGESLSGKTFRLKIPDNNTADTFSALGETSGGILNSPTFAGIDPNPFVVRKSKPTLTKAIGLSTSLINGENRLYGLVVSADNAGSVHLGRLKFEVAKDATLTLTDLKLYRGPTLLTTAILSQVGNTILAVFTQEESIGAGQSQTYYLDGTVSGTMPDSSLMTKLVIATASELVLLSSCNGNPNTGRVYATDRSSIFVDSNGFASIDMIGAEMVWSDRSSDTHSYPTVTNGLVTAGSGSCDWTNGATLGTSLVFHKLTK